MLPAGTILVGRYKLLDVLGEGGAAVVYRAQDERLGRLVAVKVLRPQFVGDAEQVARFENEARAAAALTAPNIVDVYDYGQDAGSLFIAMQYIDGRDLKRYIIERQRLDPQEAASIAADVCRGLSVAHDRGLIHRDVKPQNILIDSHGVVRLSDFGIAKALVDQQGLTQAGMTYGTAAYFPPEQATGSPVGPYSDVYSLGVVLYEMLCGTPPFAADNAAAVAYKQVYEQPPPLSECAPHVPQQLVAIVEGAMAKAPDARYPSAGAMLSDLLGFLAGTTAPAPVYAQAGPPVYQPTAAQQVTPAPTGPPPPGNPATWSGVAAAQGQPATRNLLPWLAVPLVLLLLVGGVFGGRALFGGAAATPTPGREPAPATATQLVAAVEPTLPPTQRTQPSATAVAVVPSATSVAATDPPVTEPPAAPTPVPPTAAPAATAPPVPPPSPTSARGRPIFPTPTPPTGADRQVALEDVAFVGGYRYAPPSFYNGRTAAWVYGQRTGFGTMTAPFLLTGQPTGQAHLTLTGMDSEDRAKTALRVLINGQAVFNGPNPLSDAPNWGTMQLDFPAAILQPGSNTVTVENMAATANLGVPFIMVDTAQLTWDGE